MNKRELLGLNKDEVNDLSFWVMVGVLIGSRVFHILFWDLSYYWNDPIKILYFWQGGMAFHGGLVGAFIAGWIYCRKKKVNVWKVADILAIPTLIALALGRIANFINGELVGRVTNISWCVDFGDKLCRHPYQIYDALGRFAVAGLLLFWNKRKEGNLFLFMVLLLGIERFIVDFFKEDILYYSLSVGQWMSLAMVIIAIVVLYKRNLFKKK